MYCLCSSIYRTEMLKSKLPLMSLFLCDENHVACYAILAARYENHIAVRIIACMFYTKTEIRILHKVNYHNSLEVAEVKICSHVSHGKALPLIL